MSLLPPSFEALIDAFASLPGVGKKSAQRLAFYMLSLPEGEAEAFAAAITEARENVHTCPVCQNLTDGELCPVCRNERRDRSVICVVAEPKDVMSIERSREYNGRWYTDVRAWRIEPAGYGAPMSAPMSAPMPTADDMSSPLSEDDLPF